MLGYKMKLLVRPSGTEPLLRIYFEADENEKMLRSLEKMDMVQYMGNPLVAKSIKVCLELNRK